MSAPRWRWSLIGIWMALACLAFLVFGSVTPRSGWLLLVFGIVPPLMLLWLWNEDRPLIMGTLRPGKRL